MLEYIKAGHPSPLLLRKGKVSELYTEGSFPVGLIPEAEYASARLQLEPEDTLVLFSDGVTEAENVEHELFEVSGLSRAVAGKQEFGRGSAAVDPRRGARLYSRGATSRTTSRCWWCVTARLPELRFLRFNS